MNAELLYCYRTGPIPRDQQDYKKPFAISLLYCSVTGEDVSVM